MVSYYTVFGKQVASHWVAISTLTLAGVGATLPGYLPKSEKAATPTPAPAPVAKKEDDLDVEKLVNDFLKEQDAEAKK